MLLPPSEQRMQSSLSFTSRADCCPICLSGLSSSPCSSSGDDSQLCLSLGCGHILHATCLDLLQAQYPAGGCRCPTCRAPVELDRQARELHTTGAVAPAPFAAFVLQQQKAHPSQSSDGTIAPIAPHCCRVKGAHEVAGAAKRSGYRHYALRSKPSLPRPLLCSVPEDPASGAPLGGSHRPPPAPRMPGAQAAQQAAQHAQQQQQQQAPWAGLAAAVAAKLAGAAPSARTSDYIFLLDASGQPLKICRLWRACILAAAAFVTISPRPTSLRRRHHHHGRH